MCKMEPTGFVHENKRISTLDTKYNNGLWCVDCTYLEESEIDFFPNIHLCKILDTFEISRLFFLVCNSSTENAFAVVIGRRSASLNQVSTISDYTNLRLDWAPVDVFWFRFRIFEGNVLRISNLRSLGIKIALYKMFSTKDLSNNYTKVTHFFGRASTEIVWLPSRTVSFSK